MKVFLNFEQLLEISARWSSGQDSALSRRQQGFDSPTGHQSGFVSKVHYFNSILEIFS